MKKLTLILAALVLTLGFSQCKKTETPTMNEGVFITLTAGYGNGAKTSFDPANGAFAWTGTTESPEYIYVGGNSTGYLGYLTSTESGATVNFSGTITPGAADATLYFFYLGKGDLAAATSVDFSNQDGTLENVTNYHIAISDGVEYTGQTSFSTTLNMKMAIAYFDVNGFKNANDAAETVYLHGDEVYSSTTIDYQNGTIAGSTKGSINLGTAAAGKYVALIPSVSTETTLKFDSDSKTGAMTFLRGIQTGKYYANSGAALSVAANSCLFSVSATKKVRFSKGNLQYKNGEGWRFAEHQYDYVGAWNTSNWVDLFGWGTWGNGKDPLYTSTGEGNYQWTTDFQGTLDGHNDWYTLSTTEWQHLFNSRDNASSLYGSATVNSVHGIVVLPDNWTLPSGSSFNPGMNGWNNNTYVASAWASMEAAGAVFLPAAGYRYSWSVYYVGGDGYYVSSTPYDYFNAYFMHFIGDNVNPAKDGKRFHGRSVRLVRDVQ